MIFNSDITHLERSDFIESGRKEASYFQWMKSRGTNYTCYEQYRNSLTEENILNYKIETIRIIVYALQRPITFMYFYWTILVFFIHKFNFKKPTMKLILYHFILRSSGNVLDKLGDLYRFYFTNENHYNGDILIDSRCKNNAMHPFKWFLTRQVCTILWYVGEIIGDWYPLLRTKAVLKNDKSIWFVYVTCGLFNLSKVYLIFIYLSYSSGSLYNNDGAYDDIRSTAFYNTYYIVQLVIIYTSFFYDISVYFVLKKGIFHKNKEQYSSGFLKKFKNLSEYRMLVSAYVSAIFLPFISLTILFKFYYQKKKHFYGLEFSFEETRMMITNVQYYMIFIDQILLTCYKQESLTNNYNHFKNSSGNTYNQNNNNDISRSILRLSSFQSTNTNINTNTNTNTNINTSYSRSTLNKDDDTIRYENNLSINDLKFNNSNLNYSSYSSNNNININNNSFLSNKNDYNSQYYFNTSPISSTFNYQRIVNKN